MNENQNIIIYQNDEGNIEVEVKLLNNDLWLSLNQIAELFGRDKQVISRHLSNIFKEEELDRGSVVAFFETTAQSSLLLFNKLLYSYNGYKRK